jgi:hypothetical protein
MPCKLSSSCKLLLVSLWNAQVLLTVSDVSFVTCTKTVSSQESKDGDSNWIDIAKHYIVVYYFTIIRAD